MKADIYTLVNADGEFIYEYQEASEFIVGLENYMRGGPKEEMMKLYRANTDLARIALDKNYAADMDRLQLLAFGRKR